MMKRLPAVAGQFYNGTPSRLKSQVEEYIIRESVKEKAIAVLSPHAGLMYSGHVAGAVYSSIQFPETFILIGPNHTGLGANVSIMGSGQWEIPTGIFSIDEELSRKIMQNVSYVSDDVIAHKFEHSLEVQLPFLSYFSDSVKIVPITVMNASLPECREIGEGIARSIKEVDYNVVIVASSDMSHYVPDSAARRLDGIAIKELMNLNPEGLYNIVRKERISMCGFLPATIMLYSAKALGAKEARLIKYATSGDISGDYEHVVGYAGIIIK
jgi:AmmeMemoRadiSam system protein B